MIRIITIVIFARLKILLHLLIVIVIVMVATIIIIISMVVAWEAAHEMLWSLRSQACPACSSAQHKIENANSKL